MGGIDRFKGRPACVDDDPIDDDAMDGGGERAYPRLIAQSVWDLKVPREVGRGVGGGEDNVKGCLPEAWGSWPPSPVSHLLSSIMYLAEVVRLRGGGGWDEWRRWD